MPANIQRVSATIYQFPVGGRAGLASGRAGFSDARLNEVVADIDYGSSWYHDEAVREERGRNN
jgi:hypothetical protein